MPASIPRNEQPLEGAEEKLPGASVYLTALTPFDHTLDFELSTA